MNPGWIQSFCRKLPGTTQEVKWDDDLCFSVGEKMYCIVHLELPLKASFKVDEVEFADLTDREKIIPAPYLARYKWVQVQSANALSKKEWERLLVQSYTLVKSKLPKRPSRSRT
jgi:predicted DNA-binding protein (MmcQ/YjbR family)